MHTVELCILFHSPICSAARKHAVGLLRFYCSLIEIFFLPSCSQLIILVILEAILNSRQLTQTELIRVVTIRFII